MAPRRPSPRGRLRGGDVQAGGCPASVGHAGRARLALARARRRAGAAAMTIVLVASQLLGLGGMRATALAEDFGTLTVLRSDSVPSVCDDINASYHSLHFFEVDTSDGVAFCATKNLHAPEAGAVYTEARVSNNPALDWAIYHGWSPEHQTEYGLSSSRFRFATQYLIWLAMPDSDINDHSVNRLEISRTYRDVRNALEQMEADMNAYVKSGGGGPERGCSVLWPCPGDAAQHLVTRRVPRVTATLCKGSADASLTFGNTAYSLAGATYEIRRAADDALASTVTTNADGLATCELEAATRYYAKEIAAPKGYLPSDARVEFEVAYDDVRIDVSDVPGRGEVRVQKVDSSTGDAAQVGTSLAGAELTLVDALGKTHTAQTDEGGWAGFGELPLGRVRITETRAPEGYRLSSEVVEAELTADGLGTDGVSRLSMETALPEDVVAFDLEISKFKDYGQEGSGVEQPAAGVRFQLISNTTGNVVGELVTNEYGFADTSSDPTLWFGAGTRGEKVCGAIPYDAAGYTVHEVESTVPAGFSHVGDWNITAGQMADGAKLQYIVDNHALATHLQVVKVDASSGQTVPVSGFTFQILNEAGEAITQDCWYPNHVSLDRFTTDETGCVTLPQSLVPGTYYIHEAASAAPYLIAEKDVSFSIPSEPTLAPVVIARYADEQATGAAKISKTSESGVPVAGAEFDVVALETVKSPDGTVRAVEGQVMGHVATDENGDAEIDELPLGAGTARYAFVETHAPEGYILDPTPHEFAVSWEDGKTSVVWAEAGATNALATGSATILKTDGENGVALMGAEFDVIALEDVVTYDGRKVISAGDAVDHVITGESGVALVENLPLAPGGAHYAFVETKAPEGYVLDPTPHAFDLSYKNQETSVVLAEVTAQNTQARGKARLTKKDAASGETLAGAEFDLVAAEDIMGHDGLTYRRAGEVIEHVITDEKGMAEVQGLRLSPGGAKYAFVETLAPAGYVTDTASHEFTLKYAGQDTPLVTVDFDASNDFTKVEVLKVDERGDALAGAKLVLLDDAGEVVHAWDSTREPHLIERLAPGTYTLAETQAPAGYLKAEPVTFTVEETAEAQSVTMQDLPIGEESLPGTGDASPLATGLLALVGTCSILGYLLVKRRD